MPLLNECNQTKTLLANIVNNIANKNDHNESDDKKPFVLFSQHQASNLVLIAKIRKKGKEKN